ncbi:hypothetical protein HPY42_06055 [Coprothermobacteraceae bacterium]|nr:hypothetical protein [Coprothermobacteraceae bacterium]
MGAAGAIYLLPQLFDVIIQVLLVLMFLEAFIDLRRPALMLSHLTVTGFLQSLFYATIVLSAPLRGVPWLLLAISSILSWRAYGMLATYISSQ